ncbi:MAG: hypothetical protein K6T86_15210 [Pirellulales bacterium]|nr:hypothetical protein [Pirellulales bacterium]
MRRLILAALELENVHRGWLWALLALAALALLAYTYRSIYDRTGKRLTWLLAVLRAAALALLMLALARPAWIRSRELVDPGRLAVILDNSLSMSLANASGSSRYAAARQALKEIEAAAAAGSPPLRVDVFDIEGQPLEGHLPAEPQADRTNLARALRQAAGRLRAKPLAALVLISDGVDNSGVEQFSELAELPVPVYALGFAPDAQSGRLDLALQAVQAPQRVLAGNECEVNCEVAKSGGPALSATVAIKRGSEILASREIDLAEGSSRQPVALRLRLQEPGAFVLTAQIEAEAGERLAANNLKHFPLQVDPEGIKVLYLEGYLRYEFRFLKQRLDDDPDINLFAVVRRANPQTAPALSAGNLLTDQRLRDFEVVILGDMEASLLTTDEYEALLRWVESPGAAGRRRALLVLGGYHSFGPEGLQATPLAQALPVTFPADGPRQSEQPFVLEPTEAGRQHPMFQILEDRVQNAALWATAPPLAGCPLVEGVKAGAEILAVNPQADVSGRPAPVIVVQRYGEGRIMVLGADTTWRWSFLPRASGQTDTLFARFWSQTIRWLAGRQMQSDRPPLTVSTDQPEYALGKTAVVRIVVDPDAARTAAATSTVPGDQPGAAGVSGEVVCEVLDSDGRAQPLTLRATAADPHVYQANFTATRAGRYRVAASLAVQGKTAANQSAEFLVHGSDVELADPGTNRELLRSLARLTGGQYRDVAEAASLAAALPRLQRRTKAVERHEFWTSPGSRGLLFCCFLAAVTAEWVLRRRHHII